MSKIKFFDYFLILLFFSILFFTFCFFDSIYVLALDSSYSSSEVVISNFRSKYDFVMKWINFFIMIVIFFKYGLNPLKNFIKMEKKTISDKIKGLESQKNTSVLQLDLAINNYKEKERKLVEIKEKIISDGKKKYNLIINQAREESYLMVENAKRKSESRLIEAKKLVRNEIIDLAINSAQKSLHLHINHNFNKKTLENYMKSIN